MLLAERAQTNNASATTPNAKRAQHKRVPQPQRRLDDRQARSSPTPPASNTMPSASGTAPRSGSRSRAAAAAPARSSGADRDVHEEHPAPARPCDSRPPSDGPAAAATPPIAPQSAVAERAARGGNSGSSSRARSARAAPRRPPARRARRPEPDGGRQRAGGRATTKRPVPRGTAAGAQRVCAAPGGHEQRGEDDVVGVEHPREPGTRRPGTRLELGNAMLTMDTSRKAMKTATAGRAGPSSGGSVASRNAPYTIGCITQLANGRSCCAAPTKARTARSPARWSWSASAGRCW